MKNSPALYIIIALFVVVLAYLFRGHIKNFINRRDTVKTIQKRYQKRVLKRIKSNLESIGLDSLPKELLILAFKEERVLEVYGKGNAGKYTLIKSYPFTGYSGKLGPKLQQGDRQIPEGIYTIEYLNPNSLYHLSAKISYPNEFDKAQARKSGRIKLGGDIMIHGRFATVGCIPIGDEAIEEVFIMLANTEFHKVKVIIAPLDFRINPAYPQIFRVDFENELYDSIVTELKALGLMS